MRNCGGLYLRPIEYPSAKRCRRTFYDIVKIRRTTVSGFEATGSVPVDNSIADYLNESNTLILFS